MQDRIFPYYTHEVKDGPNPAGTPIAPGPGTEEHVTVKVVVIPVDDNAPAVAPTVKCNTCGKDARFDGFA